MNLADAIKQFFDSPAGTGVLIIFGLGVLDFVLGVLAAIRDNVFQLDAVGAWIRKHLAGRLLPITAVLVVGHVLGGLQFGDDGVSAITQPGTIVTAIGLGAAAVYVAEIVGSVRESLTPKPSTRAVPVD